MIRSEEVIQKIQLIYQKIVLPRNLQMHMIRSASIASLICEHWIGKPIDKKDILASLLFHDVGNIVKCDWSRKELYGDDVLSKIEFWEKHQQKIIEIYGRDEHLVTTKLIEPLELSTRILELIEGQESHKNDSIILNNDLEIKICAYADQRAGPKGIMSVSDRWDEGLKRYKGKEVLWMKNFLTLKKAAIIIEQQVLHHTDLKAEDISDFAIKEYIEEFLE